MPLTVGGGTSNTACGGVTNTAYSALDVVARYFCMSSDAVQATLESMTVINLFAFVEFNSRHAPKRDMMNNFSYSRLCK